MFLCLADKRDLLLGLCFVLAGDQFVFLCLVDKKG